MFVELLEKLRCPNDHEPSPLIATASLTENRHIIEGMLGCPVCHAEFALHNGALELGDPLVQAAVDPDPLSDADALRAGALLALDERGGLYVLDAISSNFAARLADLSPASRFVALAGRAEVEGASGVIIGSGDSIPLAGGCARGIVLDRASAERLRAAVVAMAPGGRLVAPANSPVPPGIVELARDERQWVGERQAVPMILEIRRAPSVR
jgi:hypothetical protein